MDMTNKQYQAYIAKKAKPSPLGRDGLWAFFVGGCICTLGQFFVNLGKGFGLAPEEAGTVASMTLMAISAVLTGLGLFDKIAHRAGAGTLVPITGFANAVVSPALEFKSEGLITGTGAKLFTIAGPVLVFGISTSVLYGLILVLFFSRG